jgi:hypothetical protein
MAPVYENPDEVVVTGKTVRRPAGLDAISVTSHARFSFMPRHIDLVLVFRAVSPSPASHFSKQRARQDAQDAEDQYTRLLTALRNAGLYAVGRRGEHQGQLILLVSCSVHQLRELLRRERQDTFAHIIFLPLNLSSLQPFRRPARPLNLCFGCRSRRHQFCRTPTPRALVCYSHTFRRRSWYPSRQRCLVSRRVHHGPTRP